MTDPLFRKEAMERMASPDQLDQLMVVTTTRGWLALLALGIVLAAAVLWGFFGSVQTRVGAEGIILFIANVFSLSAPSPGTVESLAVKTGQTVEKGQTIAVIHNASWQAKIRQTSAEIEARRRQHQADLEGERGSFRSFQALLEVQRKNIEADLAEARKALADNRKLAESRKQTLEMTLRNLQSKLVLLRQREKNQDDLHRQQLIRRQDLDATKIEILGAEDEARRVADEIGKLARQEKELTEAFEERRRKAAADLAGIAAQEKQRQTALDQLISKNETEIGLLDAALASAREEARQMTVIVSPHSGRVLSVECKEGLHIDAGQTVAAIEKPDTPEDQPHDVLAYVSASEGKRIKPGMEVQVVPSTVKAEEYGVMLGKVTEISDYPVSSQAIQSAVQNPTLAQTFLKGGALLEMWIDLKEDPKTPSGFRWSSSKGPPHGIGFGTVCTAQVVVRRQAPASLVIPWLRTLVFGRERTGGE